MMVSFKQREIKFEPNIKLNHNIYINHCFAVGFPFTVKCFSFVVAAKISSCLIRHFCDKYRPVFVSVNFYLCVKYTLGARRILLFSW